MLPLALVRTIETGVTTKSEVLNLFGPPISKQIDQTGRENWSYTYSKHNVFSMHAPDAKSLLVSFVNDVVNICQVAYGGASAMNTVPCDKY
jgi:outer membrane protein assembly factor BamE (lipoprotein component of BamABCDE complex)